jgi:dihydrofolate reductase
MALIRGWIGASLDGYIASTDGTLAWLTKYEGVDFGELSYDRFITGIRTIVMGRATYDVMAKMDIAWPYAGKRVIVVTARPLERPAGPLEVWSQNLDELIDKLRALQDGDVWMVGGGRLQQAFIQRGGLDSLEIFIVPELVGSGIPLFPPNGFARTVRLVAARALPAGCVHLHYDFPPVD